MLLVDERAGAHPMSIPIEPFGAVLNAGSGRVYPEGLLQERHLSDLVGLYADGREFDIAVADGNPVVYTVSAAPVPENAGEVPFSITTIEPGDVAGELYMTKGHWHTAKEGEVYEGMHGSGILLLFDGTENRWVDLSEGAVGYIPPGWAHRTVNTGDVPFRFLAIYPGAAGHDYQRVLEGGMGARVMRTATGFEVRPVEPPG